MIRSAGTLSVLLVLLLASLLPPAGLWTVPRAPTGSSSSAEPSMLQAASSSLAMGKGPAAGEALSCSAIGTLSDACALASPAGTHGRTAPSSNVGWSMICGGNHTCPPAARGGAGMTYDPDAGYVVLFGGIVNLTTAAGSTYNDTWTFRNGNWTQLHVHGPGPRLGEYMAYDYADHYVVMFGGGPYLTLNSSLYYQDTWTFQNGTWTQLLNLNPAPTARGLGGFAWDASDGYLLMYGGMTSTTDIHSDTWTFVHGQWHNLSLSYHPPPLLSPALAYDPAYNYVLLFGGATPSNTLQFGADIEQTWSFSGGAWTNLTSSIQGSPPFGRILSSMAYDPAQGYMVLYGGWNTTIGAAGLFGDTWAYESGFWFRLFVPPPYPAIIGGSLVSTTPSAGLLLFGGIIGSLSSYAATNDTWSFGPAPNITVSYTVTLAVQPGACGTLLVDGVAHDLPGARNVSVAPGGYNVSAPDCPGYVFAGWFPSTGALTLASQSSATTTLYVVGNGVLTAYYQPTGPTVYHLKPLALGEVVVGIGALVAIALWLRHRSRGRRSRLEVAPVPPQP